jgi:diguanylate cyclase (GGDEF)-like protein
MQIPTRVNIILRIAAIIALVEFIIMLTFANLNLNVGVYVEAALDVVILVILSTPLIYVFIIQPYVVARNTALSEVSHMAYHDSLTKLANRRLLKEHLEKLLSAANRSKSYGALLFIDLDGFKAINDNNGHDAGDAILVEVARRLNSFVRNEDIVSRVGGDEFVVVLGHIDTIDKLARSKALEITERILNRISKEIIFDHASLKIGASIGLRILVPDETSAELALKEADTAMYRAKQAGKNNIAISR